MSESNLIYKHTIDGLDYGVLKTACYPASYYAGRITNNNGNWQTVDNATCNFYYTSDEARQALNKKISNKNKEIGEKQSDLFLWRAMKVKKVGPEFWVNGINVVNVVDESVIFHYENLRLARVDDLIPIPQKFPAPSGYRHRNECRIPTVGELYASVYDGVICRCDSAEFINHTYFGGRRWILEKIDNSRLVVSLYLNEQQIQALRDGYTVDNVTLYYDRHPSFDAKTNSDEIRVVLTIPTTIPVKYQVRR